MKEGSRRYGTQTFASRSRSNFCFPGTFLRDFYARDPRQLDLPGTYSCVDGNIFSVEDNRAVVESSWFLFFVFFFPLIFN